MIRIIGLDVGLNTVGIALSDPLGITAQGLDTLRRIELDKDIERLAEILDQNQVSLIVVGLPKNMNGTLGPAAEMVKEFSERLKNKTGIPVKFWDERLSTVSAQKMLISADVSRKKRKRVIDKLAAVVILQNYLDSIK